MLYQRILGLNVRPQNVADFSAISEIVSTIDPTIGVLGRPGDLAAVNLPINLKDLPQLWFYLVNPPLRLHDQGCTISVQRIPKYDQFLSYKQAGVRAPNTIRLRASMPALNADEWGSHVIVKPMSESFGRGVALVETQQVNDVLLKKGAEFDELIKKEYLIQEFIDTGPLQEKFRAIVFLGEVILVYRVIYRKAKQLPSYASISDALADKYFQAQGLKYQLIKDPELEAFAKSAHKANPQCPLQGLDIQRDLKGHFFVIENNAGGNVWKFSDLNSSPYKVFGPKRMIQQYDAWNVCAQALVRTTCELAS
jgi:hypothetical protein